MEVCFFLTAIVSHLVFRWMVLRWCLGERAPTSSQESAWCGRPVVLYPSGVYGGDVGWARAPFIEDGENTEHMVSQSGRSCFRREGEGEGHPDQGDPACQTGWMGVGLCVNHVHFL
jgi:hypothetical protein